MEVVDYSWARPGTQTIIDAGYDGVVRYLSYETAKNLSVAERDALWRAGLPIALVWEAEAGAPRGGAETGRRHALEANRQADALGWPRTVGVIYAVDFSPNQADLVAITDYFHGVNSVGLRPAGVYGTYAVLEYLFARLPYLALGWQCAAWSLSAVQFGDGTGGRIQSGYTQPVRLSIWTDLFQHYGLTRINPATPTDHNDVLRPERCAPFFHHPDGVTLAAAPVDLEDLTMKAVYLPEEPEGSPKFWQPIDGLRRVAYEDPPGDDPAVDLAELGMTMAIGAVDPEAVTLTGAQADLFKRRYYPVTAPADVHWGPVKLMVETVDRVRQLVGPAAAIDYDALAAAVAKATPGTDPEAIAHQVLEAAGRRFLGQV